MTTKKAVTPRQLTEMRLKRIDADLEAVANYFAERGFESQSDLLDAAADHVEDVRNALASV